MHDPDLYVIDVPLPDELAAERVAKRIKERRAGWGVAQNCADAVQDVLEAGGLDSASYVSPINTPRRLLCVLYPDACYVPSVGSAVSP